MAISISTYQLHDVLEFVFTLSDLVYFNSCSYIVFKVGQSDIPLILLSLGKLGRLNPGVSAREIGTLCFF